MHIAPGDWDDEAFRADGPPGSPVRGQSARRRHVGGDGQDGLESFLGSILADAQERGLVPRNVVRDLRANRTKGAERRADRRQKGKLKIGVDIPSPLEIRAFVAVLKGRWRPILLTAVFTGLRASELRGLRWADVDLTKSGIHVRQRADRFNVIGRPKS